MASYVCMYIENYFHIQFVYSETENILKPLESYLLSSTLQPRFSRHYVNIASNVNLFDWLLQSFGQVYDSASHTTYVCVC